MRAIGKRPVESRLRYSGGSMVSGTSERSKSPSNEAKKSSSSPGGRRHRCAIRTTAPLPAGHSASIVARSGSRAESGYTTSLAITKSGVGRAAAAASSPQVRFACVGWCLNRCE